MSLEICSTKEGTSGLLRPLARLPWNRTLQEPEEERTGRRHLTFVTLFDAGNERNRRL